MNHDLSNLSLHSIDSEDVPHTPNVLGVPHIQLLSFYQRLYINLPFGVPFLPVPESLIETLFFILIPAALEVAELVSGYMLSSVFTERHTDNS